MTLGNGPVQPETMNQTNEYLCVCGGVLRVCVCVYICMHART